MKIKIIISTCIFLVFSQACYGINPASFSPAIEKLLQENKLYSGAQVGIALYDLEKNEEIYSKNINKPLCPASIMKVITTYACLKKLGSGYTFKTPVYLDKNLNNNNGAYNGNLYIAGTGDPSINTEQLDALCKKLKASGINKINGNIVYNISNFDEEEIRFFPIARNLYAPPCALCLNLNCIELKLVEKPAIKLFPYPDTEYAKFNYKLKIENSNRASIPEMTVRKYDTYDAYTINGTVTHWTKAIKCLNVAVSRPGLYFATVLKETLEKNGITFNGRLVKDSFDPEGYPVFYEIESAPLIEIMKTMNRQSNNLIAENLGKYMGMKEFGVPGNREKALKVINAVLLESGFDQSSFDIRDTCGLSQQTRITSALMIHTLKTIYDNPDWKTLAIDSFDPKTYSGLQCFVKTGTLSSTGVNSLAGFIKDSKTGKFYAFCIIVNKASGAKAWSGTYTNPLITKLTNILKNR